MHIQNFDITGDLFYAEINNFQDNFVVLSETLVNTVEDSLERPTQRALPIQAQVPNADNCS